MNREANLVHRHEDIITSYRPLCDLRRALHYAALRFRLTILWGFNGTETFVREPGRTAGPSAPPDFLSKIVASADLHAALYGEPHTLPLE